MRTRCPELITKGYSIGATCRLTEKPSGRIHRCEMEYGGECEYYQEFLKEEEADLIGTIKGVDKELREGQ